MTTTEVCTHERSTFHRATTYSSAYFECDWCEEYAYDWTDEAEQDEDGIVSIWREPIWANEREDEICVHGMSLWLCADPINHYPRDGAY